MANVLRKLFGAVDDASAELARLREQVERTKAEIATEAARPVPLAEIEARLEATIAGLRELAGRLVPAGELVRPDGGPIAALLANTQASPFAVAAVAAPGPLVGWLREKALAAADKMGTPIEAADRTRRLTELKAKLADLERREAELLWSADERGLELPWRPDLDPAAVLGLEPA